MLGEILDAVFPLRCAGCDCISPDLFCEVCAISVESIDSSFALFEYGGALADAIKRAKSEQGYHVAQRLALTFASLLKHRAVGYDCVSYVPRRTKSRSVVHLPALLAQALASSADVELAHSLRFQRVRPKQALLSKSDRANNLAGSMHSSKTLPAVLVVDDLTTTGATLQEAKRALAAAGAKRIGVSCLAKAL